jgi:hypothetical protein
MIFEVIFPVYHYGITYIYTGDFTSGMGFSTGSGAKMSHFHSCQLWLNTTTSDTRFYANGPANITLYNTTVRFGATGQSFNSPNALLEITWLNTPSAIAGAIVPTTLFTQLSAVTARGVDLSAITGTIFLHTNNNSGKFLLDSCRIAPGAVRYNSSSVNNPRDVLELVSCFDGTKIINESHQPGGAVTTETTIVLAGGAQDNVGVFSHKMISNTNVDKFVNPLVGFWLDVNYATLGTSKIATVEIIGSGALNNDEISLELEYLGTTASSLASLSNSLPATVLTAASAVPTSTATWSSSPATPQRQKLQVTFTPRTAGRLRARVRLGKVSTTVWYNPQVTIT